MPLKSRRAVAIALEQQAFLDDPTLQHCDDLVPPPQRQRQFNTGGVLEFIGPMETGKSILSILMCYALIKYKGYSPENIYSNVYMQFKGAHHLPNLELMRLLHRAYGRDSSEVGRWTRCIFVIMEADALYSHLDSKDKDGAEDLWHLSQSMRFNNYVLHEYHDGRGVLKFLRDKTELSYQPHYYREIDTMLVNLVNGHHKNYWQFRIGGVSWAHNKYRRFAAIV